MKERDCQVALYRKSMYCGSRLCWRRARWLILWIAEAGRPLPNALSGQIVFLRGRADGLTDKFEQ